MGDAPTRSIASVAVVVAAAVIMALGAVGCGSTDDGRDSDARLVTSADRDARPAQTTDATLVLDFVPNALHVGVYRAIAAGYYAEEHVDLRVIQPTASADTLRLIDAGKADIGLADGYDIANQIVQGRRVKALMAITQLPLGGVITRRSDRIAGGAVFEGRTIGTTGVPSDDAVLETVVSDGGGDPSKVKRVTVGFNGVQSLKSGKLAGFVGFWPSDAVQLEAEGVPATSFRLYQHGGPRYPGIVAYTSQQRLDADAPLMRAFTRATIRGYEDAIRDPQTALDDLLQRNRSLKRDFTRASLEALLPVFRADAPRFGVIQRSAIDELSAWMVDRGLADRSVRYDEYVAAGIPPEG